MLFSIAADRVFEADEIAFMLTFPLLVIVTFPFTVPLILVLMMLDASSPMLVMAEEFSIMLETALTLTPMVVDVDTSLEQVDTKNGILKHISVTYTLRGNFTWKLYAAYGMRIVTPIGSDFNAIYLPSRGFWVATLSYFTGGRSLINATANSSRCGFTQFIDCCCSITLPA